jgi:hypothetical protein
VPVTELQTLVLWALLAKPDGGGFQKDIKPQVKKPDREALVKAGLITAAKRGRPGYWLEVTDHGWAWAAEHLDARLPTRSPAGSIVFQTWLTRLKTFIEARGITLADILGPQRAAVGGSTQRSGERPVSQPLDYNTIRERIRRAYLAVTDGRLNTRVLLSDLRDMLNDMDRSTLDEALRRIHLEPGTTLSGLNNPQELTDSVRAAGLTFKGEPMYVLWITK